ncbi:MAG TPA: transposase [Fodinibius sp.]|nr:transposase [Fodinibius sp.]
MVREMYAKSPVKTTKIHPEFTAGRLTNFSGLVPFADFLLEKLPFREALAARLDLGMGPNCSYGDWQVFGLVVFGYLCGYTRLAHFEQLSLDTTVQKLLDLDGPIDENTLAYRLKKAGYKQSVQLHRVTRALAERVHRADRSPSEGRQWLDFDSTLKGVFGHQQGAAKGFNPTRKGQRSYHPPEAFDAATKEVLHSWWRTGKAYTGNGAAEFFTETAQRLPASGGYVVRADSGFFADSFLSAIEAAGHDYLVKVKLKNLKEVLRRQSWQSVPGAPGTRYCRFEHECSGWEAPRRFS